ncbi:DUF6065 family protein [Mesorhizobium sp. M0644]|uniref:DUF6065 family protein n=1 Tax=unclassified Mesorhizobium TaxID=325217 RepID=UPI0033382432
MGQVEFYRVWPEAPFPAQPSITINGEIPARAHQFCEPYLVANSVGWLLYPPTDFNLIWDGAQTLIQFEGEDTWVVVDHIFLPGFADLWLKYFPDRLSIAMPVFIEAFPERGILQIWTGYFCRTEPGDSLWIRSPINQTSSNAFRIVEGIVETDWWAGPLFTNIEIVKADFPIAFRRHCPILQIVPFPKTYHQMRRNDVVRVSDIDNGFPASYLDSMEQTFRRRNSENPGSYRRMTRGRGSVT